MQLALIGFIILIAIQDPVFSRKILLFDGHGSHLTYESIEFCKQPYCFPSHTTHLIQPLNGQPFQVYKHYYRKRNSYLASLGVETDDKGAF